MRRAIDPGPRRVLIAELDSYAQAQQFLAFHADLPARFAGYLRSASFLAEEVAVTDVQLLDGLLPLRLGPARFRELLALHTVGAGFLVLGRAEDVTGCLRMIAADEKTGMMRPFEWSCLTQFSVDPRAVAGRLPAVSAAPVLEAQPDDVPYAISDRLITAGIPPADGRRLADQWTRWIERADEVFTYQKWSGSLLLEQALRETPPPGDLGPVATELVTRIRSEVSTRSGLRQLLAQSDMPAAQAADVEAWFNSAYFLALGRQHDADWLSFGERPPPSAAPTRRIATDLLQALDGMPSPMVAQVRHVAREAREDWRDTAGRWAMVSLNRIVADANEPFRLGSALGWPLARTVLALAAGGLAIVDRLQAGFWLLLGSVVATVAAGLAEDGWLLARFAFERPAAYVHLIRSSHPLIEERDD